MPARAEGAVGAPLDKALIKRLTTACHILYMEGQNDLNHGQISARRGSSAEYWIRGAAMGFEEASSTSFALCGMDGGRLSGTVTVPPEWPIHSAVYARCPGVNAIVHTHAPNALIFGAKRRPLVPLSHDGCVFAGALGYFDLTTNTILDLNTAGRLADALGAGKAVLLKNHGLVTVGGTIQEAAVLAVCLEQACALQLRAEASGHISGSEGSDITEKEEFIFSDAAVSTYWSYLERKLARVREGRQLPQQRY
ncbi:hypothetical protein AB838_06205 [Rhodobacteraceae bacterium (ex Bugula neritina AB1)]|nr:hypothetical protein AB838_06205 [Rhodobacteraceae bacterium (ex Bugula neritina AB1)]